MPTLRDPSSASRADNETLSLHSLESPSMLSRLESHPRVSGELSGTANLHDLAEAEETTLPAAPET